MLCSCSDSSDQGDKAEAEIDTSQATIDTSQAATYIKSNEFTVDTETLLQSIETYLSTSDAQLQYERAPGVEDLFVIWPVDGDEDIECWIHFYKYNPDEPDTFKEDITDTSEIPSGLEIQYDIIQNAESSFNSTDKAAQATDLIMRAIGFTEEDISNEKLHEITFDVIDRALGSARLTDDIGRSHAREGNFEIYANGIRHTDTAKVASLSIEPKISEKEISQRETITLGSYEQDNDTSNGKEPIEWIVLDKADDKMLVISKMALDYKRYLDESISPELDECVWSNSSIRNWLNDTFFTEAFNDVEQQKICETSVVTEDNEEYGTPGGENTSDKVFLLSHQEILKYFADGASCEPTAYAKALGSYVSDEDDTKGETGWLLRTPGKDQTKVEEVEPGGYIVSNNITARVSIRPAMWIDME